MVKADPLVEVQADQFLNEIMNLYSGLPECEDKLMGRKYLTIGKGLTNQLKCGTDQSSPSHTFQQTRILFSAAQRIKL